jgi:hypothetical protein
MAYAMSGLNHQYDVEEGADFFTVGVRKGQSSLPRHLRHCLMRDGHLGRPGSFSGEGPTFLSVYTVSQPCVIILFGCLQVTLSLFPHKP